MTDPEQLTAEAERALAGGVLARGTSELALVRAEVAPEDMGDARARAVVQAACAVMDGGADVTPVAVLAAMEAQGTVGLAGGLAGLDAMRGLDRPGEREGLLARVQGHARVRRTAVLASKLAVLGKTPEAIAEPDRYLAAVASVADRAREKVRRSSVGSREAVLRTFSAWKDRGKGGSNAAPTGVRGLDDLLTGGLHAKKMLVIGGRPAEGKTALAIQSMYHAARLGHPQLLFSIELPLEDVVGRGVCQSADYGSQRWARGASDPGLVKGDMERIVSTCSDISLLPVEIDEDERELGAMLAKARVWLETVARPIVEAAGGKKTPVVTIDYLQRMFAQGKFQNRDAMLANITDRLATFAKREACAIKLVAALNRNNSKERRSPTMADLRECGSVEYDANAIVLIHQLADPASREEEEREGRLVESDALLIADKNRDGPKGAVRALWNGPTGKFKDRPWSYDMGRPDHVEH